MSNESSSKKATDPKKLTEPLDNAPKEVQAIITRVLQLEKEHIFNKKPRILEDVIEIVKDVVK